MIALRNVTRIHPGVVACRHVTLEVRESEIHVLLGDNGAGKTTLVKVFSGLLEPSTGTVEIDGVPVRLHSPQQARSRGIGAVHQFGALIDGLTAEENVRLVVEDAGRGRNVLAAAGLDGWRLVRDLSPRERQLLSILRFKGMCRYLLLDEPTATLDRHESRALFADLRKLANEGYGILVVSHKLPEVMENGDTFTVMQKGAVVAQFVRGDAAAGTVESLLGTPAGAVNSAAAEGGGSLVRLRRAATAGAEEDAPVDGVDLEIRRGEVLGLIGHRGSGARNLLRLLYGATRLTAGEMEWFGARPSRAIGVIPERRLGESAIAGFSLAQNLALRRRELLGYGMRAELRRFAEEMIARYRITPADAGANAAVLSGGNLQKLVIARETDYGRDLLIAIDPTAGLDRASAAFVLEELKQHAAGGAAVVIYSEDPDELMPVCDRVVVMVRGANTAEMTRHELSSERIAETLTRHEHEREVRI